jgi:hypothetical protein
MLQLGLAAHQALICLASVVASLTPWRVDRRLQVSCSLLLKVKCEIGLGSVVQLVPDVAAGVFALHAGDGGIPRIV